MRRRREAGRGDLASPQLLRKEPSPWPGRRTPGPSLLGSQFLLRGVGLDLSFSLSSLPCFPFWGSSCSVCVCWGVGRVGNASSRHTWGIVARFWSRARGGSLHLTGFSGSVCGPSHTHPLPRTWRACTPPASLGPEGLSTIISPASGSPVNRPEGSRSRRRGQVPLGTPPGCVGPSGPRSPARRFANCRVSARSPHSAPWGGGWG